jgi:hypothetical protein
MQMKFKIPWSAVLAAFLVSCGVEILKDEKENKEKSAGTDTADGNVDLSDGMTTAPDGCNEPVIPEKGFLNAVQCIDVESVQALLTKMPESGLTAEDVVGFTGKDCPEGFLKIKTVASQNGNDGVDWVEL